VSLAVLYITPKGRREYRGNNDKMARLVLINITIYEPRASKTLTILKFLRLHEKVFGEGQNKACFTC
jgi:hypothetical protein